MKKVLLITLASLFSSNAFAANLNNVYVQKVETFKQRAFITTNGVQGCDGDRYVVIELDTPSSMGMLNTMLQAKTTTKPVSYNYSWNSSEERCFVNSVSIGN